MKVVLKITLLLIFSLAIFKAFGVPAGAAPPAREACPPGWVCDEDPQVKCCGAGGASEGAPCTGPWQRWEWQNCSFGAGKICVKYKILTDFCYTTDACYAVSGYPSSNSTGLIWPGKCDSWAGGTCHWGPSAYKRCCQEATPKPCSISAPYDYECDQGGSVVWGTVCTAPCTCTSWTNQTCEGWTCAATERHQTRDCPGSPPCDVENRCVADAACGCSCTAWVNQGCGPAGGCATTEMYQTRTCPNDCDIETRCVSDPACGGSTCSVTCGLPCCPGAWWNDGTGAKNCGKCGCSSTQSAQCDSGGEPWTWTCVNNPGLCGGDGPQYHKECQNGWCQSVEGAGGDQCSSDPQCRHYYCSGTGLSATCKLSLTPGTNECREGIDQDCQPPACYSTEINGGAEYINTRDVTLSLWASGTGNIQMRFRNQSLAWSAWEPYATVKGWTLSPGADGVRSVTAQYKNDIGTSELTCPDDPKCCTDSIILDTTPPTSSMTPLLAWSRTTPVTLRWSGDDNCKNLDSNPGCINELKYWFQFSNDGGISWIDLPGGGSQVLPTDKTSYDFFGEEGLLYCFRVRARDPAGNWEDWPLTYDTCTRIDLGIEMYGLGWEFGVAQPSVFVSVYDGVSGINYSFPSSISCVYSSDGGATWSSPLLDQTAPYTAGSCSFASTDPTTLILYKVPFATQSATQNKVRYKACDVAGTCLTNTYTVDNRATGPWVQTFGGDIHGNSNLQLRAP